MELIPYIKENGDEIVEYLTSYEASLKTGEFAGEKDFISEIATLANRIKEHP